MKNKHNISQPINRIQNRYRITISNDDSFEEVVTFKFNRLSLFLVIGGSFIVIISFILSVIMFTPLKYTIPGYGNKENRSTLELLDIKIDSLSQAIQYRDIYLQDLKKVLMGTTNVPHDTTTLHLSPSDYSSY